MCVRYTYCTISALVRYEIKAKLNEESCLNILRKRWSECYSPCDDSKVKVDFTQIALFFLSYFIASNRDLAMCLIVQREYTFRWHMTFQTLQFKNTNTRAYSRYDWHWDDFPISIEWFTQSESMKMLLKWNISRRLQRFFRMLSQFGNNSDYQTI